MKFKVIALSANRNSFGLRNMMLLSSNGIAVSAAANDLNVLKSGDIITTSEDYLTDMVRRGWELVDRVAGDPPAELLQQVWGAEAEALPAPQTFAERSAAQLIEYILSEIENGHDLEQVLQGLFATVLTGMSSKHIRWLLQQLQTDTEATPTGEQHAMEGSVVQGS